MNVCSEFKPLVQYEDDEYNELVNPPGGISKSDRPRLKPEEQEANKKVVLMDEDYLAIMCPLLNGFSLDLKCWRKFTTMNTHRFKVFWL